MALDHFQTVVGAKSDTPAAMDTNNGIAQLRVHEYGVDRAGTGAFTAPDTEITLNYYPAAPPLAKGAGGASIGTGGMDAGQANLGLKPGAQSRGRVNANTGTAPR
jgi:hypothetical protein